MKRRRARHIFEASVILAAIFLAISFMNAGRTTSIVAKTSTAIPEVAEEIKTIPVSSPLLSMPAVFVTHTVENPNQIPLRATIMAREASGFDEISLFVDAGGGYKETACKSLPCSVSASYAQPGTVKYYAVAKSKNGITYDPAGAPQSYKSFKAG